MGRNVEKITVDRQEARLPQDLERYRQLALDLGADRAAIVKAEDIPVDERVVLKCRIPRCFGYGAGAHCPPHALSAAELRALEIFLACYPEKGIQEQAGRQAAGF